MSPSTIERSGVQVIHIGYYTRASALKAYVLELYTIGFRKGILNLNATEQEIGRANNEAIKCFENIE